MSSFSELAEAFCAVEDGVAEAGCANAFGFPGNKARCVVVGPSGSGKTEWLCRAIATASIRCNHLLVCTKTPDQAKYRLLRALCKRIADKLEIAPFCEFFTSAADLPDLDKLAEVDATEPRQRVVIFDDLIGSDREQSDTLTAWFARARHLPTTSLYLLMQAANVRHLPTELQNNASHWLLFPGHPRTNAAVYEAAGGGVVDRHDFDKLCRLVRGLRHGFVAIDVSEADKHKRFLVNGDSVVNWARL